MQSPTIAGSYYNAADTALTVSYGDGSGVFRFFGVSENEYMEFREAPSQDAYINYVLKDEHHPFVHLDTSQVIHLVPRSQSQSKTEELRANGEDSRRRYR
jgi:hypothetical protein